MSNISSICEAHESTFPLPWGEGQGEVGKSLCQGGYRGLTKPLHSSLNRGGLPNSGKGSIEITLKLI